MRESLSRPANSRSKLPVPGAFFNGSCKPVSLQWLFLPSGPRLPHAATLTDGVTAFVSIKQSDDGAQGRVRVALDALQLADGIVDVVCTKSVLQFGSGTPDTRHRTLLVTACFHPRDPETGGCERSPESLRFPEGEGL